MKKRLARASLAALILGFLLALFTPVAFAQTTSTLWLFENAPREAQEHEATLSRVFEGAQNPTHIVGRSGIEDRIRRQQLRIPRCYDGHDDCTSTTGALMQALAVDVIVRLRVESTGVIEASAYNNRGEALQRVRAEARTNQAAMANIVAQLTGASGTLIVDSSPRGARVLLNGNDVGTTPFSRPLPVGAYEVDVQLPGWSSSSESIVVPPNGNARLQFTLERSFASLTVRSGTPGAYVLVDNTERYDLHEKFYVSPGEHEIRVLAPGYDPIVETQQFDAGVDREMRATLYISRAEQTRRRVAEIRANPLMIQAGLRYEALRSDWSTGRVTAPTRDRIDCSLHDGVCEQSAIHAWGMDVEALYAWRYLEIEPLGLSVYKLGSRDSVAFRLEEDAVLELQHDRARRFQLRLAHVGARFLVNEYFEPYVRAGFSLGFDRLRMTDRVSGTPYTAKRVSTQLEIRAGARIHVNRLLYGYAEIGAGMELSARHSTPAFQFAGGVGINLPSPFEPREHSETTRRTERQDVPEEL